MNKFKPGDAVIITFEGDFHEPTDKACSFIQPRMSAENGKVGTVVSVTAHKANCYTVDTGGMPWEWHESALKRADHWRVKKLQRKCKDSKTVIK